jgi:uncharacterized protein (DUF1330 family)
MLATVVGFALGAAAIQALHAQTKLPAYAVLETDVTNVEAYLKEYAPLAAKALIAAGGKFLARGGKNIAIDGEPPKSRTNIVAFDSLEQAQVAFTSPEYREIRKTGEKYAKFRVWVVEGLAR